MSPLRAHGGVGKVMVAQRNILFLRLLVVVATESFDMGFSAPANGTRSPQDVLEVTWFC
jgi:hypothetical protein